MLVEIELKSGAVRIVNADKILYCHEERGKMSIEIEDGTPLSTAYTKEELVSKFRSAGVLCIDLSSTV